MKRTSRTIVAASVVALCASSASAHSVRRGQENEVAAGVARQSQTEARQADTALIANELGLPVETIERSITFQERFARYAADLIARYPDQISRIWLEPVPSIAGHVQFTGAVPNERAPVNVRLTGDGIISLAEHDRRAELASAALREAGYTNFETYFNAPLGRTQITMRVADDIIAPERSAVIDIVQQRIWNDLSLSGAALVLAPSDLEVLIERGEGEIFDFDHSRGGNWLLDDGFRECTSGWSVDGPDGPGIITAAHCVGLNQFEEPGLAPYGMSWRDQERGDGDTEYHTTTHIELAEFYASAASIRSVEFKMPTWLMLAGTTVCVYGRSSDIRSCAHSIESANVTVTFTDGVTVSKLARASGDTSIPGDSGGGWSFNTTAWGVHSGSNNVVSYFTPIDTAEAELGVSLLTAP